MTPNGVFRASDVYVNDSPGANRLLADDPGLDFLWRAGAVRDDQWRHHCAVSVPSFEIVIV